MYKDGFIAAVKCGGNVLREFNSGVIKLPFGADYSIILKNKSKRKALVGVRIDGEDVIDGNKLIVCYDSPFELKGYMDGRTVKNSFRFIERTGKISSFRGNKLEDGLVEIYFSFEQEPIDYIFDAIDYIFDGGYRGDNRYATCNVASNNICSSVSTSYTTEALRNDIGITVKGKPTSQNFDVGSFGNTDGVEHSIIFKLQGSSGKSLKNPVTVKTKVQCPTCGQKAKATANYCSNCSTYLQ